MRNRFVLALAVLFLVVVSRDLLAQVPTPSPNENPEGNTGALKAQVQTAGSYDAHSGNATRIVNDLHVPGALGTYGLDFTRYWNSVHNDDQNPDADFPMDFGASGWSHSWKWTATFGTDVQQLAEGGGWQGRTLYYSSITITFPDGHANKYNVVRASVVFPGQDPYCVRPGTPWGPPYLPQCGETNWNDPGIVDDHLRDMAQDGSNFWLVRADGVRSISRPLRETIRPPKFSIPTVFAPISITTATATSSRLCRKGGGVSTLREVIYLGGAG